MAIVGGLLAGIAIRRTFFKRHIASEVSSLLARRISWVETPVTEADLEPLPEPVQNWLRWAGVVGTSCPETVHLTQQGRFRLGPEKPWMPFTAEEQYTTNPPGFIWPAVFQIAPFLTIEGRDAYIAGHGSIDMRLLGLIPVAQQRGPEMDQGALLRFLNEIVWFPAAALATYITWDAIDATSARATIGHGGVTASADFFFDDQGRPLDMRATRYRSTRQGYELSTWSTPFSTYGEFAGIRVPIAGEGVWKLASGDFTYVDLHVESIAYDPPPRYAQAHTSGPVTFIR
jgi:hypothetical protein